MTAPTIYRWDDPGAPTFPDADNSFYEIIYGCLVNGYEGKAAAGWASLYDTWGVNGKACIQNASKSGVLGLVRCSNANYPPALYVADGMVDADTPIAAKSGRYVITDLNLLSATGAKYQRPWEQVKPSQWVVIANENFAIVWVVCNTGSLMGSGSVGAQAYGLYSVALGAIDSARGLGKGTSAQLGNFVILGGYHNRSNRSYGYYKSVWRNARDNTNHSTVDLGSDGARGALASTFFPSIVNEQSQILKNDNAVARFRLSPLDIVATHGDLLDGWQVGSANMILHDSSLGYGENPISVMGHLNKQQLKDIIDIDGKQYVTAFVRGDAPVFISLAAEDWS